MTKFVPCIDLHDGQVKQIIGSSLKDESAITNYTSPHPPSYYANLYKSHHLFSSHLIMLGPGNQDAALDAIQAWPFHIQVGGGISMENAQYWLEKGASKVIVTSFLFPNGQFELERLQRLCDLISKEKLVVDLSCKRVGSEWIVAMNKWQTLTNLKLSKETLITLSCYCSEFLIHAADVEGLCNGIDEDLVKALGEWTSIPTTYVR